MTKNVGGMDRNLRIGLGALLIIGAFVMPETLNPWGFIGIIPLATGLMGWCPLYIPLGIKTCKTD
ncbi:YgaP family membrane protein [Roseospira visakhapatnamensis]|uniref:Inner membrane protein YgaP-like transmembrane domain-containing protein n=1 Tax=Roseospira visakhapatnamensis TaxID=390880 RepID=A0A7W6W9G7_9PROT|nr:DUF2892 domain-containing protein [Roseospira visakhapatnamensis]MBB4265803.1 hypothetical protein [Roseospira visakhapatnamensis]